MITNPGDTAPAREGRLTLFSNRNRMDRGWIKIYRSLLDWEWFDDAETLRLFIYLLLNANYEDKKWRGMVVERGQYVASFRTLAVALGISVKKVRTRLQRLSDSGAIAMDRAHSFTTITISNYDTYQDTDATDGHTRGTPKSQKRAHQRAHQISELTNRTPAKYEDDDFGKGTPKGTQRAHQRATTKEDKKIRSLSKEEVANATSKKRATKKGKGESGEDPKSKNAHKTPTEASTETLEGGMDRLHTEGDKTPQSTNLEPSGADEAKRIDYEAIKSRWNEETGGALGKLVMITGRRREMVRARIRETSVDDFFTMIHNAASSSFLRGESQRGWVANFDWCIRPNNYPKVLEGRYNDHEGEGVILPPNAKRVTDSSEGVDYRYIDFRELDKQHRR